MTRIRPNRLATSMKRLLPRWAIVGVALALSPATPGARAAAGTSVIWSWGGNEFGELGRGATCKAYSAPEQVPSSGDVSELSSGEYFTLALAGGKVYTWGQNYSGQLGLGSAASGAQQCGSHTAPSLVPALTGVRWVAAGTNHALAVLANGTVVAWGDDSDGELGRPLPGSTCECIAHPVEVKGLPPVNEVAAGDGFSLALTTSGQIWSWGTNYEGQLGIGSLNPSSGRPVHVKIPHTIIAVAAGQNHVLALMRNGSVWSWGANEDGQLGNGIDCGYRLCFDKSPQEVRGVPVIVSIAAGGANSAAIDGTGRLYTWGDNQDGQLGSGTTCYRDTGQNCVESRPNLVPGLTAVTAVSFAACPGCVTAHALAITEDGRAWAWGDDSHYENGNRSGRSSALPISVTGVVPPVSEVLAGTDESFAVTTG